ncbi:MAG: dihydropteroate synthase [Propionibacteriaceae bacterium]|nr:dihydropteroate synthase [Propionibacteriaceae bacterium]
MADPHLAPLAARTGAGLIVTHSLAAPRTHLRRPYYQDVVAEVRTFLADRVASARDAGVAAGQLILDPGPDLNKNTLHTLELLRRFQEFTTLGYPVLAALSNKDFIGETLDRPKHSRLAGSLAAAVWCIERDARIVRVHDVPRHVEAVRMTEALLGLREPAYLRHNLD